MNKKIKHMFAALAIALYSGWSLLSLTYEENKYALVNDIIDHESGQWIGDHLSPDQDTIIFLHAVLWLSIVFDVLVLALSMWLLRSKVRLFVGILGTVFLCLHIARLATL